MPTYHISMKGLDVVESLLAVDARVNSKKLATISFLSRPIFKNLPHN